MVVRIVQKVNVMRIALHVYFGPIVCKRPKVLETSSNAAAKYAEITEGRMSQKGDRSIDATERR